MRWSEVTGVARRSLPIEEGVGWFFVHWVLDERRGQPQIARLIVVPDGEHLELVCPLAPGPVSPQRLLAEAAALALGSPVIVDGRACLRHVFALDGLDEENLLRRMGQLAGEALAMRELLAR